MIWTTPARADLAGAVGFAAEHSPAAAVRLLDDAERASESLGILAERGRLVPELAGTGTRERFVQRYRMI